MKALLIGTGGTPLGQCIRQDLAAAGYDCSAITSQPCSHLDLQVDWNQLDITDLHRWLMGHDQIDLVFFMQNSSSLGLESWNQTTDIMQIWHECSQWRHNHWTSSILPYLVIRTLGDRINQHSRVAWMLSEVVQHASPHLHHADYVANKYQNYLVMKNFAQHHPACFFGVNPGAVSHDTAEKSRSFVNLLQWPCHALSGRMISLGSQELPHDS